ncbi:hypothetical protein BDZ97DRAFT_1765003, partial [Flammula alnicola]
MANSRESTPNMSGPSGTLRSQSQKSAAIVQNMSREELLKRSGLTTAVKDAATARKYLEGNGYMPRGEPATLKVLALLALQLAALPQVPKAAVDGIRAIAFLTEDYMEEEMVSRMVGAVLERIEGGIKELPTVEAIEGAAEEFRLAAREAGAALEDFKEECQLITSQLQEAADAAIQVTTTTATTGQNVTTQGANTTYADML